MEQAPDLPVILSVPPSDGAWWETVAQRLHPWRISVLAHPPDPLALRGWIRFYAGRGVSPVAARSLAPPGTVPKSESAPLNAEAAANPLLRRLVDGLVSGFCQWQAEQLPGPADAEADSENLRTWQPYQRLGAVHRATALSAQLALLEQPQIGRPVEETALTPVVEEVVAHLRRLLGGLVEVEGGAGNPVRLAADPAALHRVLTDLALLALPAFPRGARLRLRWETQPAPGAAARTLTAGETLRLLITVQPPPADAEPGPAPPGAVSPFLTGLEWNTAGMVIARWGGQVERLRLPAGQSGFEIRLPALAGTGGAGGPTAERGREAARGLDAPPAPAEPPAEATVLLVDDDESVRATTRLFLEEYDCRILEATDSTSALRLWREQAGRIHLLVVDLVLPGEVDGLQLARRLQSEQPGLRTLLTTGYAGAALIEELKSMPNSDFLPKPYTYAQMHAVLRRHLRPRAAWV